MVPVRHRERETTTEEAAREKSSSHSSCPDIGSDRNVSDQHGVSHSHPSNSVEVNSDRVLRDTGTKSWVDIQWDLHERMMERFPCSRSRTTFYVYDFFNSSNIYPSYRMIRKYDRFFRLQHGFGHTYEGWEKSQRVRIEDLDDYRRTKVLLSQIELAGNYHDLVLRTVSNVDLRRFNRHYQGIDGAVIGLALRVSYDDKQEANSSYHASYAKEILDVDVEKLINYVWKKFDGDLNYE